MTAQQRQLDPRLEEMVYSGNYKLFGISPAEVYLKLFVPEGEKDLWEKKGIDLVDLVAIRVFDNLWVLDYSQLEKFGFSTATDDETLYEFEVPHEDFELFFDKERSVEDVFSLVHVHYCKIGNALFKPKSIRAI